MIATEVLLQGGTVISGSGQQPLVADVLVSEGRIAQIAPSIDPRDVSVVDCRGALVVPGLVDLHVHVNDGALDAAVPADRACLQRGVVAVCDAGSVGAAGIEGFRMHVVAAQQVRVLCFLNVSRVGIVSVRVSELAASGSVDVASALDACQRFPHIIRGLKVRLGREQAGEATLKYLEKTLEIAEQAKLPVMVHPGEMAVPLGAVLERLRPGDILTHCFSGLGDRVVDDEGRVRDEVVSARSRGVTFDVGHGTTQFSYRVASAAIAAGFSPDVISSDTSRRNWYGPAHDLLTVMSKCIALGMPEIDAVAACTSRPADVLGLPEYGSLELGRRANISVIRKTPQLVDVLDGMGESIPIPLYEPEFVLCNGMSADLGSWRGPGRR